MAVLQNMVILIQLSNDLQEGEHREISNNLVLNADVSIGVVNSQFLQVLDLFEVVEFPNEQECISDVFVGGASVSVDHRMSDFSNSVYVGHDVGLKNFCALIELIEDTETKDCCRSLSRHHWVKVSSLSHVLTDDACSSFSKAESEKITNLDNCSL